MKNIFILLSYSLALQMIEPYSASAYIGPGAGITAIGTVIALIFAIFLAIVGYCWYPIKRLLTRIKKRKKASN